MTTTTTFQGMDPSAKNSSRVLRPPGGNSNICFGTDEERPVRKNRMASNIFAEPEDPHAHRRNNPPGGEATGVLCGEHSAPLRRCHQPPIYLNNTEHPAKSTEENHEQVNHDESEETEAPEEEPQQQKEEEQKQPSGASSGRRNPPGGKSSLILG
ncbi:jupiter microtubule associated homolog 1b isoform X2 [Neoarius graeffei]|uniref:jupiter microtubule associated homolog 1b isoform X2 n=1 Tax=Neoarius graeffei TaxID=443677 RepID=UPI00298D0930|nr:jupiter microtubule associated homolog 1b isoform X2 [Neoarius graeffei]